MIKQWDRVEVLTGKDIQGDLIDTHKSYVDVYVTSSSNPIAGIYPLGEDERKTVDDLMSRSIAPIMFRVHTSDLSPAGSKKGEIYNTPIHFASDLVRTMRKSDSWNIICIESYEEREIDGRLFAVSKKTGTMYDKVNESPPVYRCADGSRLLLFPIDRVNAFIIEYTSVV